MSTSIPVRLIGTYAAVLGIIFAMLPTSAPAYAQESVFGDATGVTVTANAGWIHDPASSVSDGGVDSLVFVESSANFVLTSFASGAPEIAVAHAMMPIQGEVADVDVTDTYALRSVSADGGVYGVFSVVGGSDVQTVIAPISGFAAAVSSAQEGIQINGGGVLQGVDGAALGSTIEGAAGVGDTSIELPALVSSGPPSADSPDPVSVVDAPEDVDEEATAEDAESGESVDTPADPGQVGFLDDNTWVSPLHGTRVAWDDSWEPRTDDETGKPTFLTLDGADILCLDSIDAPDGAFICVTTRPHSESIGDQETWNNRFLDPESKGTYGLPRFGVVITAEGFSYGDTSLDLQESRIAQGVVRDGIYTEMTIRGPLDQLTSLLAPVQAAITVDDNPAFHLQDVTTFTSESEALVASLPALIEERDATLLAMGLIDANHYVSVATGCDISWDDSFELDTKSSLEPISNAGLASGEEVGESFHLTYSEYSAGLEVRCYADSGDWEGDFWWAGSGYAAIEGEGIRYGVSPERNGSYEIYVIISSPDSPALVEIMLYLSTEDLAGLINTGGLVVNGVDVFQSMENSDLLSQLP